MAAGPAPTMTLWRWRLWFVIGHAMLFGGAIFASDLLGDGSPAWAISAAVAVTGAVVMGVATLRRHRAEKLEAAERSASPPDPNRWRVTEIGRDGT